MPSHTPSQTSHAHKTLSRPPHLLQQHAAPLLQQAVDHDCSRSGAVLVGVSQALKQGEQEVDELIRREALRDDLGRGLCVSRAVKASRHSTSGPPGAIRPSGPSSLNTLFLALRCQELLPGARGCGPVREAPTPHWSLVLPSLCPKPTALCCTPSSALHPALTMQVPPSPDHEWPPSVGACRYLSDAVAGVEEDGRVGVHKAVFEGEEPLGHIVPVVTGEACGGRRHVELGRTSLATWGPDCSSSLGHLCPARGSPS